MKKDKIKNFNESIPETKESTKATNDQIKQSIKYVIDNEVSAEDVKGSCDYESPFD